MALKKAAPKPAEPDFYIICYLEQRTLPGVGWDMAVTYAPDFLEAHSIAAKLQEDGRRAIRIKPWSEEP